MQRLYVAIDEGEANENHLTAAVGLLKRTSLSTYLLARDDVDEVTSMRIGSVIRPWYPPGYRYQFGPSSEPL